MEAIREGIRDIGLDDVFGPDGFIAINKPGYEVRQEQIETARTAEQAILEERDALIEAGTGTGKSFALLVPAILSGKRTVVSTETNTLLDQYVLKDLPFLQSILPIPFSFAKAKGKSNFVCLKRVDDYLNQPLLYPGADYEEVDQLLAWARTTQTGDRSEPTFKFSDSSWGAVCCDELCPRRQCPYYGEGAKGESGCFAYQARRAFLKADIVVTNHTLNLLNAQIGGDAVFQAHQVLILDEAHTLAEQAQKAFGFEVKQRTLSAFIKYSLRLLQAADMPASPGFDATVIEAYEREFFHCFKSLTKQQMIFEEIPAPLLSQAEDVSKPLISKLEALRKELNTRFPESDEDKQLLRELDDKALQHINSIKGLFEPDDNWLAFAEVTGELDNRKVTLHYKPVDVAPILQRAVFSQRQSTIMASATLAVSGKFDFFVRDVGVQDPLTLQVGSSFDYVEQCTGYYPIDLPDPGHPEYQTRVAAEIEKVLIHTNGRAFVLFTNYRDLKAVHELVSPRLRYDIYKQGDLPKPALIERFREEVHSVLFATRSFFTGVDIPGESLSCVILVKAPFRPPDEPLFAAKCRLIKARGGNDFIEYALPLMVNDLRQAFGRLIRSKTDTGTFAFLDSRAINKPYFRVIRNSLPVMKVRTTI